MSTSRTTNFIFVSITLLFTFLLLFQVTFAAPAEYPIITELQYHPIPSQKGEWLEIFNPTNQAFQMKDWRLEDNDANGFTFPDLIFEPGDYLLMPRRIAEFESNYGGNIIANLQENVTVIERKGKGLNNKAGIIMLKNSEGDLVDKVAWGGVEGWNIKAKKGQTISRKKSKDTNGRGGWKKNGEKGTSSGTPGGGTYETHDEFFELGDFAPTEPANPASSEKKSSSGGSRRYATIQKVGPYVVRVHCSSMYCPKGSVFLVSVVQRKELGTHKIFASS